MYHPLGSSSRYQNSRFPIGCDYPWIHTLVSPHDVYRGITEYQQRRRRRVTCSGGDITKAAVTSRTAQLCMRIFGTLDQQQANYATSYCRSMLCSQMVVNVNTSLVQCSIFLYNEASFVCPSRSLTSYPSEGDRSIHEGLGCIVKSVHPVHLVDESALWIWRNGSVVITHEQQKLVDQIFLYCTTRYYMYCPQQTVGSTVNRYGYLYQECTVSEEASGSPTSRI